MDSGAREAVEVIEGLFDRHGRLAYGETVNQIEHALQCATLAERAGAAPGLVLAALLHDLGHMLHRDAAEAFRHGVDDHHEMIGARFLSRWFGNEVTQPIAMHVAAKRYLCAVEPTYAAILSPVSQRTLEIQGGPMSSDEAARFAEQDHAADAVAVRRWDEEAKRADMATRPLGHFLALVGDRFVHR